MNPVTSIFLLMGVVFISIGLLIWKKKKYNLIHRYHYDNVDKETLYAYGSAVGKVFLYLGVLCVVVSILVVLVDSSLGWIVFFISFIVAIIFLIKIEKKYNGRVL